MSATAATALRRAAGLLLDLVVPVVPAALIGGTVWSVVRPDRADGYASLGGGLLVAGVILVAWVVGFLVNDVVTAAIQGRTLGERACGFALQLPEGRASRVLRLGGRAVLRGGLAWLTAFVAGLAGQSIGEDIVGLVVGVTSAALLLVGACSVAARGPTTLIERVVGLEVRDDRRVAPPAA